MGYDSMSRKNKIKKNVYAPLTVNPSKIEF